MTTPLIDLSHDDLSALHQQLSSEHADLVARGVCLNIPVASLLQLSLTSTQTY